MKRRLIFAAFILLAVAFMLSCSSSSKSAEVTLPEKTFLYTGSEIKPEVTVTDGDTELVEGKDYTVSYSKNKDVGTAELTVNGKGDYDIEEVKEFKIVKSLKLKKNQYSKYIQGKLTSRQLKTILNMVMAHHNDRQTIDEEKISSMGKEIAFNWWGDILFSKLKSYEDLGEKDQFPAGARFSIDEANQMFSAFSSFRFKKDRDYMNTEDFRLWTNDKKVNIRYYYGTFHGSVKLLSARCYAKKIEIAFQYETPIHDTTTAKREKYVAVLKKQSNGKYQLDSINLKDTYGMETVPNSEYSKLIKGKLTKKQLNNVISAVMISYEKPMGKKQNSEAGFLEKNEWNIYVHAFAFGKNSYKGIKIKKANRILSFFTTFRYENNSIYKTNNSEFYAKTSSTLVRLHMPATGIGGSATIKAARYNSKKMVILFTLSYDSPLGYYKAILKKDKTGKFKLNRIELTKPHY